MAQRHLGFWACMDTLKEKKQFDDMYASGNMPWALWEKDLQRSEIGIYASQLEFPRRRNTPLAVLPTAQDAINDAKF